jgi:hypothetical protein
LIELLKSLLLTYISLGKRSKGLKHCTNDEVRVGMRKKGETAEQDRAKPQPRKKKEREDARKKKKLDRAERQRARQ